MTHAIKLLTTYLIGLLFGTGIILSGMINPAKVLNFFDVFGTWDPSLIFVMIGAASVTFVGYRLVFARSAPVFESAFSLPSGSDITAKLISGAVIFGVGWGISGFCPGGALPGLGTGRWEVFAFIGAVSIGILATNYVQRQWARKRAS